MIRKIILLLVAVLFALPVLAQTTAPAAPAPLANIYAAGVSYNESASPAIAGTALYARLLSDGSGTYAFTVVDALPNSLKPFTVSSNIGVGIAQKLFNIKNVPVFMPTSAGVSFTGSNTGWNWSTGAMISVKIKGSWYAFPNVRVVKSSVTGGTGYQPIVGVLFGWSQ